jgi:5-methylcytosine-specific restriction endonuclease McrA
VNPRHPAVARRARHQCEYCHAPEKISNSAFEIEHIEPVSRGGTDASSNLALACPCCNGHKSAATTGWDDDTAAEVSLFNPREDRWDEHFAFDVDTGTIHGMTPPGRATVGP